jgi:uncharacterized protein (DUF1499 family)
MNRKQTLKTHALWLGMLLAINCPSMMARDMLDAGALPTMNNTSQSTHSMPPKLPNCPQSPNCVCSTDSDVAHRIAALHYGDLPAEQAMQILKTVLLAMTDVVEEDTAKQSIHAEMTSSILRFVDDVDVLLNAELNQIEIRSASRTGYSDFGVNKRRVERIRIAFEKAKRLQRS